MLALLLKIFGFRLLRSKQPHTERYGMVIITFLDESVLQIDAPARMIQGLVEQATARDDVHHTFFELPMSLCKGK